MRWPKYWSFSFNIIPSKEIPGLISFRMDWLKASILQHSAFFTVQLSHPYMTTGKTIALTRRTSVGKVMSLLLNMLSRLVITFLPRSKRLLISCYIYTMEYYSAVKKNSFESVLMRWMKLEPIIQSQVSQKEKHQYGILTHIYGI